MSFRHIHESSDGLLERTNCNIESSVLPFRKGHWWKSDSTL